MTSSHRWSSPAEPPRQPDLCGRGVQGGSRGVLQLEQLQRVLLQQWKLLLGHEQRRLRARGSELRQLRRAPELPVDDSDRRILRLNSGRPIGDRQHALPHQLVQQLERVDFLLP